MAKKDSSVGKAPAASKVNAEQAPNLGGAPTETNAVDQPAQMGEAKAEPPVTTDFDECRDPVDVIKDGVEKSEVIIESAPVPRLRVTAKIDGFRRAGRPWSKDGIEVLANEFSSEQLASLMSEPNLIVEEID